MKEIKQAFSWYYNKRHRRRGTLWGERFKSVIVENGETLINCLAYIDLNPIRAAIVERPEDYRWSSLGYHIQTGNRDGFLSFDFGPVKSASLSLRVECLSDQINVLKINEINVKRGVVSSLRTTFLTVKKVVLRKIRIRTGIYRKYLIVHASSL